MNLSDLEPETKEAIREIAFQAAGVATMPFMTKPPYPIMPTEEVSEGVNLILEEYGIGGYDVS